MEETLDTFDFALAETLHMTLAEMNERMPNNEYLAWRAFYNWRAAQQELANKAARQGR
jgi:hypothetical protein